MNHFDEMTALLYLEGQLDADHGDEISRHVKTCAQCRELLLAVEREGVWLREALGAEDEAIPARLMHAPERSRAPWGWITALGLSAAGAYTLWTGLIEPWQSQAAQAGFTQGNLLTMLFFSGAFWKGWDAMRSLMEFLATGTLMIPVMWLLRRHWRRLTTFAIVVGCLLFALLTSSPAGAAETKHGDPNYTLPSGQTVHTDLFAAGERVEVDGDVDGDFVVWAQTVVVNGHIKGDVICFGQELRVNGPVDGNVRAFTETTDINSTVGRNLMAWSKEITIENKGSVAGTATIGSTDATVDGKIGGDVLGFIHTLEVNGQIGGNVNLRGDYFNVGSSAAIDGHVKFEGRHDPEIAQGAKVGPIERIMRKSEPRYDNARYYWHQVLYWGVGFVYGIVLLLLLPSLYFDATQECKKYAPAAGFGLLFFFGIPIAVIIACITIVGLGIGIATLLLYIVAIYTSTIFVSGWLGEILLGAKAGTGHAIARLALGLFILHVLRILPYIGGWILFIEIFWGLGALMLALYKRMRPQMAMTVA